MKAPASQAGAARVPSSQPPHGRHPDTLVALTIAVLVFAAPAWSQPLDVSGPAESPLSPPRLSLTQNVFIGGALEGDQVRWGKPLPPLQESGSGLGITLGYGFSPTWAMVVKLSRARVGVAGVTSAEFAHIDLGARFHVAPGPRRIVPFVDGAMSFRRGYRVSACRRNHRCIATRSTRCGSTTSSPFWASSSSEWMILRLATASRHQI